MPIFLFCIDSYLFLYYNKNMNKQEHYTNNYIYLKSDKKYCLNDIYWVCSPDADIVIPVLVDMQNSTLINMLTFNKCPLKLRDFDEKRICEFCSTAFNHLYNKDNLFCMPSIEALATYCFTKGHGIDPTFKLPRLSDYELMDIKDYEKVVKSAFKNMRFDFSQVLKLKLYVENDIFDDYVLSRYKDESEELKF